jgi:hypothetical protein
MALERALLRRAQWGDDLGADDDTTEEMPRPMTERERKAANKRARKRARNLGVRHGR